MIVVEERSDAPDAIGEGLNLLREARRLARGSAARIRCLERARDLILWQLRSN